MNEAELIWLDAAETIDEKALGAKAMSLVRLKRIGLAVPSGFCISEAVFRQHLEQNKLTDQLKTAVDDLAEATPSTKTSLLSDLRQAIIEAPLAEQVRQRIEEHYRVLGADRVAVRSSATAEDLPGHSFAGQYDTYLGVANIEDCIEAVKKCWASLWTERAYDYRQRNGFDHLAVSMAVIAQSLIAADASGVLFTADPITGESDRLIIEACFGLGDVLVSGKVTPDRFVVSKDDLAIMSKEVSQKQVKSVLDDQGSVKEEAVGAERASESSIDASIVTRLADLAKKPEIELGCPQDIEWAVRGTDIFFLQARPITTVAPKKSWEDRQIWCSNPAKEVMPDVVTPMTLSMLLETVGEELFDPIFRMLCIDRGDHSIYTLVAGRIYFNANIWGAVFRCVPGVRNVDLMEFAGGHETLREVVRRLRTAADEDLPDVKFSWRRFIFNMPLTIIRTLLNTPRKGQRILATTSVKNQEWNSLDVTTLSAEQITMCCQERIMDLRKVLGRVLPLFSILAALPVLYTLCAKWFKDENSLGARLLAGLGGMDDAVAGLQLWRLAVAADARPDVKDLVLSNEDWHTIEGKLSQLDSGKRFLGSWENFMACHGHHCRGELELYNRRWCETPDYILKLVRTYITQIGKIDPVENYSKRVHERQRLEQQCRQRLKNPIKRLIFNRLLARSQKGSVFRENVKSEVIKLIVTVRKMLLELGRRLGDKEVLKSQDDIFFLQLGEIAPVVQGKVNFDIHQVVSARRAEYDRNCLITPPDVVFGKFDADRYSPDVVDTGADVLNGFAASPGVATGKARVILSADNDQQLLAGEILVAPFTDPGWTPYFVPAAGIVMDQGGLLSHGSIVAREYGIPAVVNVGPATQIIKTGQTIQVDGNQGIVRILMQKTHRTSTDDIDERSAEGAPKPTATISPKKSWEDRQIWCSNPAKEVIPDVVTPMTLSMLSGTMAEAFFDPVFHMLCIDRGEHPIYTLIAGRIYFNANIWGAVLRCMPGGRSLDWMELAGGHEGVRQVVQRLQTATDEDLPDIKFNQLKFVLKMPLIIIRTLSNTPRKGQRILARISAKNEEWNRLDVTSLSAEQITACCEELIMELRELLGHVLYLFSILAALPILYILCAKWFKDEHSLGARLLAGLGGMDDAVAGLELWRLAVAADARPEVKNLILSNEDWRTIEDILSQLDSGKRFLESWEQFMVCHGHHCRAEIELYNRRWFETPDYILKLVRTYMTQIGEIDPVETYTKRARERQRLEQQCRQHLRNPIKRMIFNRLVVRSQKGSVFRENVKSEVIKLIVAMRKMLLELGRRLWNQGALKDQDDIFFLQLEETVSIAQGKVDFDIHQVVSARRAEYEKNKLVKPPDVVFGKFDADRYSPDVVATEADVLNGFAASPGVATGKARVILRADNDEQLLAGEILVAPFTDPGWTPYFVPAAGIVMDQGGLLSHGSIVAREYGIPAVVNVGSATQIIKTGQTIQVDGNRGVVRIL